MVEEEHSTGSFSIFIYVAILGQMAYIFLLRSIKRICYISKEMSLTKRSGSCGLLLVGSIFDENRTSFSSSFYQEFYFLHVLTLQTIVLFQVQKFLPDICNFPSTNRETLLFVIGLKQAPVPEDHSFFLKSEERGSICWVTLAENK